MLAQGLRCDAGQQANTTEEIECRADILLQLVGMVWTNSASPPPKNIQHESRVECQALQPELAAVHGRARCSPLPHSPFSANAAASSDGLSDRPKASALGRQAIAEFGGWCRSQLAGLETSTALQSVPARSAHRRRPLRLLAALQL